MTLDRDTIEEEVRAASEKADLELVKFLIEQGGDINNLYNVALKNAEKFGQYEVLRYIQSKMGGRK